MSANQPFTSSAQVSAPMQIDIRNVRNIDWTDEQNARKKFSLRFANAFLVNEKCSDLKFYVPMDGQSIPAHSLIVSAASPVLERLCFGTGDISGQTVITVPEYCSSQDVHVLLRYLYVGGIAEGIDEFNVTKICKMADYLELCALQEQCEQMITSILSDTNVCEIFNSIHNINSPVVIEKCMDHMGYNTMAILRNGSLMNMNNEALDKILGADAKQPLAITSESDLVLPLIQWANEQCCSQSLDSTQPKNRRKVIGERLKLIRFGIMNLEEFMNAVHLFGEGIFTDSQISNTVIRIYEEKTLKIRNDKNEMCMSSIFSNKERYTTWKRYVHNVVKKPDAKLYSNYVININVSHMKKPFTLHGFELMATQNLVKITDQKTGLTIPFTQVENTIIFTENVVADANGEIALQLPIYLHAYDIIQKPHYPQFLFSRSFVSSITYSKPI